MRYSFYFPILYLILGNIASAAAADSWIDSETGHTIIRLSTEPYATLPYFTTNIFSRDNRSLVYISGRGIQLANLTDFTTSLLVSSADAELQCIEMGRRSDRLFYLSKRRDDKDVALRSVDLRTREVVEHARLPAGYRIESINADETLAAGVREEADATPRSPPSPLATKGELLYQRVTQKIPMALFVVDLASGARRDVHRATDWLSHPQFSPADPQLLMYSHEGPWHQVDRIWTIRTDGSERRLVHRRTREMEITGHEFWSRDGTAIHYDWQRPKGQSFYLATYRVNAGTLEAAPLNRTQWSIHFNAGADPLLFVGDGADNTQVARSDTSAGIYLYRLNAGKNPLEQAVSTEKLVDLAAHDYGLEPNARLTPDQRWVIFRSNIFGAPSVFAVSLQKAATQDLPVISTTVLARQKQAERRRILVNH